MMKLLFILVVASVALPAVVDAVLDYEFQPADEFFGVIDGGRLRPRPPPSTKLNARILATKKKPPPKTKKPKQLQKLKKRKSPPPPPKSPPPPLKSPPPPPLKSPPPPLKSPPPPPLKSPPPPPLKSPPPPPLKSPPPPPLKPPPPPLKSPPPPLKSPPPPNSSPPPTPSPPPPPTPSPPPPLTPSPPSPPTPTPPSPPTLNPPSPTTPSPPSTPSPPPPPTPSIPPPRNISRWDKYYMNNWTPKDPPGGLVLTEDQFHVDMKITSPSQIFGNFLTQNRFIFGYFSIYMKLIPNDSAGIIMTYYFSSPENHTSVNGKDGDTHDEVDFEFLGNTSGNPITLQTNLILNGKANREQRHYLPFDPSADFHKYSLLWNQNLIIWYIDDSVIRVHHNKGGVPYPTYRPMAVVASLWNGSSWATQGGTVKLNISNAPFVLQYEGFDGVDGCTACPTNKFTDPSSDCPMSPDNPAVATCSSGHWWNDQSELTSTQIAQLKAHEQNYVIYNYCYDNSRFGGTLPPECKYNEYV